MDVPEMVLKRKSDDLKKNKYLLEKNEVSE
jgi:hypothetical protein